MTSTSLSVLTTVLNHVQTTESKHYEKENSELKQEIKRLEAMLETQNAIFDMTTRTLIQEGNQLRQRVGELTRSSDHFESLFEEESDKHDLWKRTAYRMAYRKTLSMPSDPTEQKKLIETYMQDLEDSGDNHCFVWNETMGGPDVGDMDDPHVIAEHNKAEQKETDVLQQVADHVSRGLTVYSDDEL